MVFKNDDFSLRLTKAHLANFFPNVSNSEVDYLQGMATSLFSDDSAFFNVFASALVNGKAPVRKNEIVVSVADYYPEGYVAGVTDAKGAFEAACAAALEGSVIQWESGKTHFMTTGGTMTKSFDIDGNGAGLIVDPTNIGAAGSPVFYFTGSIAATAHSLTSSAKNSISVTLSTIGEASNYAAGDNVIISDSTQVRPWDYGGSGATPTYPEGYIGREEITTIKSVNAGTGVITLLKPIEWTYSTTPVIRKITKMLKSPRVRNFSYIHEIDPGSLHTTSTLYGPNAPHIVHGQYCHTPRAEHMYFEGWNLHTVNWHRCINPQINAVWGRDPYRPEDGGHGYLTRFDRTLGGHIQNCYSENVRHHTDFVMAIDATQSANLAVSHISAAYAGHGLGSKRIHSDHDTVSDSGTAWGWMMGNLAFGPDYDFTISSPRYSGTSSAIVFHAKAENLAVINPDLRTTTRAVVMTTGAKGLTIDSGSIEIIGNSSIANSILIREKAAVADPYGIRPGSVRIRGTKLRGSNPQIWIDSAGSVELMNLEFEEASSTLVGSPINLIQVASVPASFRAAFIRMAGEYANGIYFPVGAPAGEYSMSFNDSRGHTARAVTAPVAPNMKFVLNSASDNGSGLNPWNITGDKAAAITGTNGYGAIIVNNSPAV